MFKIKSSMIKLALLLLSLIVIIGMVGCSSSRPADDAAYDIGSSEPTQSSNMKGDASGGFNESEEMEDNYDSVPEEDRDANTNTRGNRKVIKSAYIEMETKTFDQAIDEINRRTLIAGGYVESSNVTGRRISYHGNENRRATFRIRIPQNQFEDFLIEFGNIGNVILSRNGGEDITYRYYDTEARLKTLEIQEDRLLDILSKAGKVEDIIELERELSNIRYEIENLTGTLKKWDDLISYATLEVQVYEVQEIKEIKEEPVTLWDRIENSFNSSINSMVKIGKDLLVLIAALAPFLVILIPATIIIVNIYKKTKNNDNRRL